MSAVHTICYDRVRCDGISVIGGPDDQRIVSQTKFLHLVQNPSTSSIDHRALSIAVLQESLPRFPGDGTGRDQPPVLGNRQICFGPIDGWSTFQRIVEASIGFYLSRIIHVDEAL